MDNVEDTSSRPLSTDGDGGKSHYREGESSTQYIGINYQIYDIYIDGALSPNVLHNERTRYRTRESLRRELGFSFFQ